MDPLKKIKYKQFAATPFQKETNVSQEPLTVYSMINPNIPPYLPYRNARNFSKFPGFEQQIKILQYMNQKSVNG